MSGRPETNDEFARMVGPEGPVHAVGGNTRPHFGGPVDASSRPVSPPSGVVEFIPTEMMVRVGAGTLVTDLDVTLAESGQLVALPARPGSTVGGALAVGRSGLFQSAYGLVRDTLLEARYVTASGDLVRAGAPVVKNVSGFDVCRLLVGSLGTIGLLSEVVLRTRPVPAASRLLRGPAPAFAVFEAATRPAVVLSDRESVWVILQGEASDVDRLSEDLSAIGFEGCESLPPIPPHSRAVDLGTEEASVGCSEIAHIGTGSVLTPLHQPPPLITAAEADLSQRIRRTFDPSNRFNRGRRPWLSPDGLSGSSR